MYPMSFQEHWLEHELPENVNHADKEDRHRYLIDTMHHSYVDIGRPVGIFFPEEIPAHFAKRKKLAKAAFLLLIVYLIAHRFGYYRCSLFVFYPSSVYRLLSPVYCLLSTVSCLLSTVSCLLSTVYCLL